MPPALAALLCTALIIGLLIYDSRQHRGVSKAIWIPITWILIIGSRLPSEWLFGRFSLDNPNAYVDGSPLDRNVFLLLMVMGVVVLLRRSIDWRRFAVENVAIAIFFAYALASVTWSDFPFVALKRWYKVAGHLIMVLVVLTDPQPAKAFAALFRRCAYVLLPMSVLFIKYFPELGRGFDFWTGAAVNPGVTTNKNALGNLCLVAIPFLLASLLSGRARRTNDAWLNISVDLLLLIMGTWLLIKADSTAALMSSVIAVAVVFAMQVDALRRRFTVLVFTVLGLIVLLLTTPALQDAVILALGEDTTLTGRTDLWADLQQIYVNPIVGVGFESFWIGDRVAPLWEKYWWKPNQAHNGYYEMYLNLGILGLVTLGAMIVSSYRKSRTEVLAEEPTRENIEDHALKRSQATFKLAFLVGILLFNLTDATFKALHLSFFVFFVVSLSYARTASVRVATPLIRKPSARALRGRATDTAVDNEGGPTLVENQGLVRTGSRAVIMKPRTARGARATVAKPRQRRP